MITPFTGSGTADMGGYEELMANVAAQEVNIYTKSMQKGGSAGFISAGEYIFDDSRDSSEYPFGFIFICKYFGIDVKKSRAAIKALRREMIKKRRICNAEKRKEKKRKLLRAKRRKEKKSQVLLLVQGEERLL